MLYGTLNAVKNDHGLNRRFQLAFDWLEKADLKALPEGKYEISGDDVYASVMEYETQPKGKNRFERHEKYFDVQYLVWGEECFCVYLQENLVKCESCSACDTTFYEEPSYCSCLALHPGELAVVGPQEAHKPKCMLEAPCSVRKIVVKVRV